MHLSIVSSGRRRAVFITFLALVIAVCISVIAFHNDIKSIVPPGVTPTYALGNASDYHQYLSIIKLGREGHILYHNVYSELPLPDVLLQPVYAVVGMLSIPFAVTLADIYFAFHVVSLIILTASVFILIARVCTRESTKWLGLIFFFSATGYWWIYSLQPFTVHPVRLPDFNFDLFKKYFCIPPHHNIAIAVVIAILLLYPRRTKHTFIALSILSVLLGLLHPYILLALLVIVGTEVCISMIREKKIFTHELRQYIIIIVSSLPVILYNIYIQKVILNFTIATDGIFTILPRSATPVNYYLSLGPLFLLALPSFFVRDIRRHPVLRLMILWAYVPVVLFFFPDLKLPIATWRLFQIYQHIPLAVLSSVSLSHLIPKRIFPIVAAIVGSAFFIYGAVIFWIPYRGAFRNTDTYFYINYFIPDSLVDTYAFLERNTPADSVVLSGEFISVMMPEYTHNRVVIGHQGDNADYAAKFLEMQVFFGDPVKTLKDTQAYLDKRNISYIVFGGEVEPFSQSQYVGMPIFKEIYHNDARLSVVRVLR